MRRLICLALSLVLLFSLCACGETESKTATETKEEKPTPSVTTKKEVVYDKVDDPLTPEKLAAIPVAREGMTSEELRQICIDFVKLSVSFQWVSNMEFSYRAWQGNTKVIFQEGNLWGGIPYVNTASGNIYRILDYYDTETGILDVKTFLANSPTLFGTACSGTVSWGWQRVINSATFGWTHEMTAKNGFIPVGPYTYDLKADYFGEGGFEGADAICQRNGEQVMYESYALTLPGDCLVNTGHVRMTAEKPVVVRNPDGTINGKESYIVQVEQGLFTDGTYHLRRNSYGVSYKIQGNDGYAYTFENLFKTYYMPHTFAEFLGTDPVEEAYAKLDLEKSQVTADELAASNFSSNYTYSDIIVKVVDGEGNQKLRYTHRSPYFVKRTTPMAGVIPVAAMRSYASAGGHKIEISAQLSTGEVITAYSGELIA